MAQADADRNLLFGIMALQMDFISRDALIAAMNAWVLDKGKSLGEILVGQGALAPRDHALLEPMVARHVEIHGGDPEKSLAAVSPVGPMETLLREVADYEVHASLAHVGMAKAQDDDHDRTATFVGAASPGGRFRILRFHDEGGLGKVFVARDEELHREVALKQIKEEHADDTQRRARFVVEAEITGGLEHPGIVPVYGLGQYDDGRPFYAMRFIQGDNLKHAIERFHQAESSRRDPGERALELRRLLGRFLDVCNAMAYAHSRGVLHRDLKPGNIMLGTFGETLVVDWGLAKSVDRPELSPSGTDRPLVPESGSEVKSTVMGARVGTPAYMSPEQAAGRLDALGPASDVYSLGATLYCLLTGHVPFTDRDLADLLRKVERGEFPPPRAVNARVGRGLDAICRKAMALRPEDRYATPRLLADDIEHWLADEPVSALAETRRERLARWARRHRTWVQAGVAALVMVTVVSIVAAGFVNQARGRAEDRRKEADKQRGLADEQRKEADKQRGLADEQRKIAYAQKQRAEFRLAESDLDRGLSLCEQGDSARGILWMARGLEDAPADAIDLQRVIRLNLNGWPKQITSLLNVFGTGSVVPPNVAFSPDGKTVLIGDDNTARLWDAVTGKPVAPPLRHQGWVFSVAFSPDGKTVLTGSYDGTARLWDAATGKPVVPPLQHQVYVQKVAFSPDGKTILTGSFDGTAWLWDAATGKPVAPPLKHGDRYLAVAFSPDSKTVLTGSNDSTARLWDASTGKPVAPPLLHQGVVDAVVFSPDGKTILTGSYDSTARLWDASTDQPVAHPLQHQGVIRVSFSPDGKTILTGSNDQTARLWDASTCKPVAPPLQHQGLVSSVAFSPDGKTVLTGGSDGKARLWDASTGKPIVPLLQHQGSVPSVAFSPDGKTVLTGSFDGTARLWDTSTGKPVAPPLQHPGGVDAVAFSPDGKTVLTGGYDGIARLWDTSTGKPVVPPLQHQGSVRSVAFSPDGKTVLTGSNDQTARLWDASTGKPAAPPLPHQNEVHFGIFSPDGKTVLTGGADGTARLWETATGKPVAPPLQHQGSVRSVAFSPDGKTVLTGSVDNTARLWDAATGKPVAPPLQHPGGVTCAAFSPDGKTVLTGSVDNTARLWEVPAPVEGDVKRILLWVQVLANMELDSSGATQVLKGQEWLRRRRELGEKGGPPSPIHQRPDREINWHESVAASSERASQWFAARWHLDRLIESKPDDATLYARRGHARVQLGQWIGADADFVEATEREARFDFWFSHALLRLHIGDVEGYRTACAQVLQQFETTADFSTLRWIVMIGTEAPDSVNDLGRLVRVAEKSAALNPNDFWNDELLARALYRAGRYEEALQRLGKLDTPRAGLVYSAYHGLYLAMAHHGLGHSSEARAWLAKAEEQIDQAFAPPSNVGAVGGGPSWIERLELSLLRREAKTMIQDGHPLYLPANVFTEHPAPERQAPAERK